MKQPLKDTLADLGGYTIKDEKHDAIPKTPEERKLDRQANEFLRKAEKKARDKGRKR